MINREELSRCIGADNPIPDDVTVVDLLRRQALASPDATALVCGDFSIDYREFDRRTDYLAEVLINNGVKPGGVVGIDVQRSERYPLCVFAVLKAGAAYLPMDPSYPADRLKYMLEDAVAQHLIIDEELDVGFEYGGRRICSSFVYDTQSVTDGEQTVELPKPAQRDLMLIIYTSGSTGNPKGVCVEHHSPLNYCLYYASYHHLAPGDAVTAYANFAFAVNIIDMYPTLISGAALHILTSDMRLDLRRVIDYVNTHRITVAFFPVSFGRRFATDAVTTSLRAMSVAGERFIPIESMASDFEIYNCYGSSELVSVVACHKAEIGSEPPIGAAVDNIELYIVDEQNKLLPRGEIGELCVSGPSMARGYQNMPEKTQSVFVPNPFTDRPGYERMYRTGDVGKMLEDGTVMVTGRRDFQVKIRGFRVELAEIDVIARGFPGVTELVTVARDGADGEKSIVTYFSAEGPLDQKQMKEFLSQKLPHYMIPSAIVQLDTIPKNPNGKIDRKALPTDIVIEQEEIEEPADEAEDKLRDIAAGILKIPPGSFGVTTDLAYVGLHSLLAIELSEAIRAHLGVELSTIDILARPAVREISQKIRELRSGIASGGAERASDGQVGAAERYYPLSADQLGMFLGWHVNPDGVGANVSREYSFSPKVDANKLAQAVRDAIDAHPQLKAHIAAPSFLLPNTVDKSDIDISMRDIKLDDESKEIIMRGDDPDKRLEIIDKWVRWVRDDTVLAAPVQIYTESEAECKERRAAPVFDLHTGPLYRIEISVPPNGGNIRMMLDVHHIVFDGASEAVFVRDVVRAYESERLEGEVWTGYDQSRLDWQKRQGDDWRETLKYFDERLSGIADSALPEGQKRPEVEGGNALLLSDATEARPPDDFCVANGLSANSLFLASLSAILASDRGQDEVLLGGILSGRDEHRAANTVGMLIKSIPFIVRTDMSLPPVEFCRSVQNDIRSAMIHSAFSLVDMTNKYPRLHTPVFYIFHGDIFEQRPMLMGLPVEGSDAEKGKDEAPTFPLEFIVERDGSRYLARFKYSDALFERSYLERLLREILAMAEKLALGGSRPVGDLLSLVRGGK